MTAKQDRLIAEAEAFLSERRRVLDEYDNMTKATRTLVKRMHKAGIGPAAIAGSLNLSRQRVGDILRQLGLTNPS